MAGGGDLLGGGGGSELFRELPGMLQSGGSDTRRREPGWVGGIAARVDCRSVILV